MIHPPDSKPVSALVNGVIRGRQLLPVQEFADVLLQLRGDPNCPNSNCGGRGWDGFARFPDGTIKLNACPICATYGETELLMVLRGINATMTQVNALGAALSECLERIEKNQAGNHESTLAVLERVEARLNRPGIFRRVIDSFKSRS
ncbi:MAG TPA: hypothetical protein DCP63_01150 [Bacteroidetes bacterium]|nr:hypothetical protein [Bacteroidota bacterium]